MSDPSDGTDEESAQDDDDLDEIEEFEWEPPTGRRYDSGPNLLGYGPDYDPSPRREKTRSELALGLLILLGLVALSLIGLTAWHRLAPETTKDLTEGILSPLIAVTGTALGFYFGGHHGPK
jgi:hypothetical protein